MTSAFRHSLTYLLPLAILWIFLWIIYYFTPFVIDDEHFRNFLAPFFADPGFGTLMESWKDSFNYRFFYDNGRLFNLIATPLLIIPKWILSGLLSACSIVNIYLIAKISGVWKKSLWLFCGIIFLYIFTLPWADHMFTTMFSLNYVVASIPALLVLYVFIHGKRLSILAALALGFLTAWCHEGSAGPVGLGLLVCITFYKRFRTRTALFLLIGMAIGVFYLLFLVPGTRVRASNGLFGYGFFNFFHFLHHAPSAILLCLITLCAILVRSWWKKINHPALLTIYGTCAGGFAVWLLWMTGARLTWILNLSAIIGISLIILPLAGKIPSWVNRTLTVLSLLIIYVHLAACIPYARAYMHDYNTIRALDQASTTGEVFYDTREPQDAPWYIFGKVNYNGLHAWTYSTRRTIPTALSSFLPEKASVGTSNISKAYIVDGKHVVLEDFPGRTDDDVVDFIINGRRISTSGYFTPFHGADGKEYLYCRPGVISMRLKWENISGVIITPEGE